jgi:precorrin-2 dehydrogenase / sirohydrochlorin ferrochelatase
VAFDYVISLDLDGRRCVVIGGGAEAVGRIHELLHVGARTTVISARPDPAIAALAAEQRLTLHERGHQPGDLDGAFLCIVTREEPCDTAAIWHEATAGGVLTTVLDENEHCHYAQPALVRRGDLRIAIATAGKAPALAKRLRQELEQRLGPEYGDLVDVLAEARAMAVPRQVDFDEWARRWEHALTDLDGLLDLVREGRRDEVRARVYEAVREPDPPAPVSDPRPPVDDARAVVTDIATAAADRRAEEASS